MRALENATDIVWLQTAFLGDVILTTAAIEVARKALGGIRQHIITTPLGAKALAGEASLTTRVVFDKKGEGAWAAFKSVKRALRSALPEGARPLLLQPHTSHRSSLLARYLGLPTITYWETRWGGHARRRVSRVATLHEATRIGLLLEPLGIERRSLVEARPKLTEAPLGTGPWQARLGSTAGALIGIAPGSVWGTKRWTQEGFTEVARRLLADGVGLIVLLGTAEEAPITRQMAAALNDSRVLDIAGKTSLDELRAVYPRLSLVLTNDSSPVHYASAFNVPTVAVFGATVPSMGFGPLADRAATPGVVLACRPCSDHGPKVCPLGHFKCMRELSAPMVHAACAELLRG